MAGFQIKVWIVCSGLGHIQRGYESFTRECFDALKTEPSLKLRLFKGGGSDASQETRLWNLPRHGYWGGKLGRWSGRGAYFVEQVTFFLSLLPWLIFKGPDVIYFSDGNLGNLLWQWRRISRQRYKLLFSNGGPISPPFPRWDLVQQVVPSNYEAALAVGVSADRMALLPYGFKSASEWSPLTTSARAELRMALELPPERSIVLSVGALDAFHKRMDYVIREVEALSASRPFLLLLGQWEAESPAISALATELLGFDNFKLLTVPAEKMPSYYAVADIFVLASLNEGFGRVYVEAALAGLRCVAHESPLTRYVLEGEPHCLINMQAKGALKSELGRLRLEPKEPATGEHIHSRAYARFGWDHLRAGYVAMLRACAAQS
ncbi:MAG: glycosyltransferase family 4 protein [Opitutaceae bacterium]|jgi:glycosyltransferase involved in cell wall biosynthesis